MKEKLAFISFVAGLGIIFLLVFGHCFALTMKIRFGLFIVGLICGLIGFKSQRAKLAETGLILTILGMVLSLIMLCPA